MYANQPTTDLLHTFISGSSIIIIEYGLHLKIGEHAISEPYQLKNILRFDLRLNASYPYCLTFRCNIYSHSVI